MSLVTRCPACDTLFKVVADQLKISDGWVRCGQCSHVFDAQAQVEAAKRDAAANGSMGEVASVRDPAPDSPASAPAPLQQSKDSAPANDLIHKALAQAPVTPERSAQPLEPLTLQGEPLSRHGDPLAMAQAAKAERAERIERVERSERARKKRRTPTPDFVHAASRAARWRSPWVRVALSFCLLALSAALMMQFVWREKDALAAEQPRLKPWLDAMCRQMGCVVGPLQRIEWIVVDGSSFNRLSETPVAEPAPQSYRLSVTVKNSGNLAVALPHLELSLQDVQDQTIVRRVLAPTELGATAQTLGSGQEFLGGVTLQVNYAGLGTARISGYRVLAFYP